MTRRGISSAGSAARVLLMRVFQAVHLSDAADADRKSLLACGLAMDWDACQRRREGEHLRGVVAGPGPETGNTGSRALRHAAAVPPSRVLTLAGLEEPEDAQGAEGEAVDGERGQGAGLEPADEEPDG